MEQSPRRPRVLVVSPYFEAHGGGVEIVAGQVAAGLARLGFSVTWAASDSDPAPAPSAVRCMPMRSSNAIEHKSGVPVPLWTPGALRQLWGAMRESDVVLMHESLYLSNLVAACWARGLAKPLLLVQHVGEVPYRSAVLRGVVRAGNAVAARLVHLCAARVVYVSAVVRDYFRGRRAAGAGKELLIANGLDPLRFSPLPEAERGPHRAGLGLVASRPALLFVGRFVEKKGLHLLQRLARARPEWQWLFVGSGPIDPAAWGLPQVRVVGRVPQEALPDWYRAADLLVLPSVGEGFPLVVQEAMACGLPVAVATETADALPGVREVVLSEEVHGADDATLGRWLALLDAAVAAGLEQRRPEVAAFAARHWSWQRCVDQYAALIEEVA